MCCDPLRLQHMKKALKRSHFRVLGIEGTLSELGKTKNFTKVDCENGH